MNGMKKTLTGIYVMLAVLLVSIKGRPTRRFSSDVKTLVLAAVVLLVAAGGASALPICAQPGNTDIGASCELDQNWAVTTAGEYGYKITADNVTIDGNGFTITGTMPAAGCGGGESTPCACSGVVNNDFDNVVVKDLKITEFCTGIVMGDDAAPHVINMTVIGCEIHNCGEPTGTTHGAHLVKAHNCTISRNKIYEIDGAGTGAGCGGGGNGIFMYGGGVPITGNYNEIIHNNLDNNNKSGVFSKMQCQHCNFSYNNATGNQQGGLSLMCLHTSYNLVEGNNASGNDGWGIEIGGYNNTIRNNTVNDNGGRGINLNRGWDGYAIPPDGAGRNKIVNNTACRNFIGVYIAEGCPPPPDNSPLAAYNELYNNTICDNSNCDIENNDATTTGDWNMCYTSCSYNSNEYNDTHNAAGHYCYWQCAGAGPDIVIRDLNPHWNNSGIDYNVSFEVYNKGSELANTSNVSVKIVNRSGVSVHDGIYPIGELLSDTGSGTIEIGPFNFANALAPHDITVCADIDNNVSEYGGNFANEKNNCSTDAFGAPDLVVTSFPFEEWMDPSKKLVNLSYTVTNRGDANATGGFWVRIREVNDAWDCPCYDYVPGPLNVGDSVTRTISSITVIGNDWVEVYADWNDMVTENCEVCSTTACDTDNCGRRTLDYPGPCLGCGDVDCVGGVAMTDCGLIDDYVSLGGSLSCTWAGDVDCVDEISMNDCGRLDDYVSLGDPINCCPGGCP